MQRRLIQGQLELSKSTVAAIRELKTPPLERNGYNSRVFAQYSAVLFWAFQKRKRRWTRIYEKINRRCFPPLIPAEKDAIANLKKIPANPTILAPPRTIGQYTVDTNEYNSIVGCLLLQKQEDGTSRPIGYWSRTLTSAKQKLGITHKELLAVVVTVLLL